MCVQHQVETQPGHDEEERRQQALGPPGPEVGQIQAAGPHPFLQQQRGDEEPRQDEEEIDAQIAARSPAQLQVVRHHARHGECPQAVECGQMMAGDGGRAAAAHAGCNVMSSGDTVDGRIT